MSDVPDWSSVQSESVELLSTGTLTVPVGASDATITVDNVPPLLQGYLLFLTTPPSGIISISSVLWVGNVTQFQLGATLSGATPFFVAYGMLPGSMDSAGTITIPVDNTGPASADMGYQLVGLTSFDLRGSGQSSMAVDNDENTSLYVITGPNRPLSVQGVGLEAVPSDGATEQGNAVTITNTTVQLVAAPPSGKVNVIDTLTWLGNTAAGELLFRTGGAGGTGLAAVNIPANPTFSSIPPPVGWYMTTSLWVQWTGSVGCQIQASWHTVDIPVA